MPRGIPKSGWRKPSKAHFRTTRSGVNYGKSKAIRVGSPKGSFPRRRS